MSLSFVGIKNVVWGTVAPFIGCLFFNEYITNTVYVNNSFISRLTSFGWLVLSLPSLYSVLSPAPPRVLILTNHVP